MEPNSERENERNGDQDRNQDRSRSTFGRFLGWVNADEVGIFEEEDDDDDHDDHHDDDHYEPHIKEKPPNVDDTIIEDYEGDDEFEYPDEIVALDGVIAEEEHHDDEIDYADSAPTFQETVHMTKKQKIRMRRFRAFYLVLSGIVALNVIGVLLLTVNYLPPFGGAQNPAVNEVYDRFVYDSVAETGALNIVSAVLYAYRSFDTLGEAFVLFTAAIGVIMLLRETKDVS